MLCHPGVIFVIVGAAGTVGSVTTGADGADAGPTLNLLIAATVHVYVLPEVRPVTFTGELKP